MPLVWGGLVGGASRWPLGICSADFKLTRYPPLAGIVKDARSAPAAPVADPDDTGQR
jgi:hypothetical protein